MSSIYDEIDAALAAIRMQKTFQGVSTSLNNYVQVHDNKGNIVKIAVLEERI